jgi:hypothetical protein
MTDSNATMDPELKKEWVEALRSGRYKQGKNTLRTKDDEYCCLGVLCDIAAQKGLGSWHDEPGGWYFQVSSDGSQGIALPPTGVARWAFQPVDPEDEAFPIDNPVVPVEGTALRSSLAELNDEEDYTFSKIADVVEKYL